MFLLFSQNTWCLFQPFLLIAEAQTVPVKVNISEWFTVVNGKHTKESFPSSHVLITHSTVFFLSCSVQNVQQARLSIDDNLLSVRILQETEANCGRLRQGAAPSHRLSAFGGGEITQNFSMPAQHTQWKAPNSPLSLKSPPAVTRTLPKLLPAQLPAGTHPGRNAAPAAAPGSPRWWGRTRPRSGSGWAGWSTRSSRRRQLPPPPACTQSSPSQRPSAERGAACPGRPQPRHPGWPLPHRERGTPFCKASGFRSRRAVITQCRKCVSYARARDRGSCQLTGGGWGWGGGRRRPTTRERRARREALFKISKTLFYFHSLPLTEKIGESNVCFTKIMHLPEKKTLNWE